MKRLSIATTAALTLILAGAASAAPQQQPDHVSPLAGALVLAGAGPLPDSVVDVFLHLAAQPGASVLVISGKGKPKTLTRWRARGAVSAKALAPRRLKDRDLTLQMLSANAVWFEDGAKDLRRHKLFVALLRDLLARGGVVGGGGHGALALAGPAMDQGKSVGSGFGLLPDSAVELVSGTAGNASSRPTRLVKPGDGFIGWQIPAQTALVIHQGRRAVSYGKDHIVARIPEQGDWSKRDRMIQAKPEFKIGDHLHYELDFMAWRRSARDRRGPIFPPSKPGRPHLAKGTLVLSGGGGVNEDTFDRFIQAAGGKDARIVCIPSATYTPMGQKIKSYSARKLRGAGCTRVVVLNLSNPHRADQDRRLLRVLEEADGIWIDGGRTYNIIDGFHGTKAHELMRAVLARGGVIGGSSAGCQVAGDFLLRGNPRTNKDLVFEGYTRGLGFLQAVVLDAHFRQRDREKPLSELISQHPQLLGIGVDADTAIVVRGSKAEVVGSNKVSFCVADAGSEGEAGMLQLEAGQTYDMVKRRAVK